MAASGALLGFGRLVGGGGVGRGFLGAWDSRYKKCVPRVPTYFTLTSRNAVTLIFVELYLYFTQFEVRTAKTEEAHMDIWRGHGDIK